SRRTRSAWTHCGRRSGSAGGPVCSGVIGAAVADAGLVAFGVGHEDPVGAVLVEWLGSGPSGAEGFESVGFGLDVGGVDVKVHAVLDRFGFGHLLEEELGAGSAVGEEYDVGAGVADVHVVERC